MVKLPRVPRTLLVRPPCAARLIWGKKSPLATPYWAWNSLMVATATRTSRLSCSAFSTSLRSSGSRNRSIQASLAVVSARKSPAPRGRVARSGVLLVGIEPERIPLAHERVVKRPQRVRRRIGTAPARRHAQLRPSIAGPHRAGRGQPHEDRPATRVGPSQLSPRRGAWLRRRPAPARSPGGGGGLARPACRSGRRRAG